ncbi:hypothetical protein KSC_108260 [Ktedonobacter sp. SOSP1-52]|uniref:hypothetical protein n=1 Tax=Ktedonobacter sp. SOSP1-52 TaxID=2778366 RepID=UPI00191667E2|nr:hypothetical protein [Ktedonobacter sp. SOSP1-52]GHO71934.1 hypothetical protein KSC_108260 [Ktedonobacter sp. SOSP1-52]
MKRLSFVTERLRVPWERLPPASSSRQGRASGTVGRICQRHFDFLREWLGIALSMLRGEFRETEQLDDELESVVVHEEVEVVGPTRPSTTRNYIFTHSF